MAEGLSAAQANAILDSIAADTPHVKLHTGAPGAAGTANAATETTRKPVTFGAASGGSMSNSAAFSWTAISGSQDATHATIWDNLTAGNFNISGVITANAYIAGDTYTVAIGGCVVSLTVAS